MTQRQRSTHATKKQESFGLEVAPAWTLSPGNALIGGSPFSLYQAAVALLAGFALKHIDFVATLKGQHPELLWRNLLTIPVDRQPLIDVLSSILDVSQEAAEQAIQALTLDTSNVHRHSRPGGQSVPFIRIASNALLRSTLGILGNPWGFLLEEIRERFPHDWDRATSLREPVFQRELYDLFPEPSLVKIPGTVRIRRSLRGPTSTDLDAVVYDRRTGTLAIFQLKWQDTFGSSMRARESRKQNFLRSSNAWIQVVRSWLNSASPESIAQHLRLSPSVPIDPSRCRIFVLGRNFAHFSGDGQMDTQAAWGHWPQFVRLSVESATAENRIEALHRAIQEDSPRLRAAAITNQCRPEEFTFGENRVVIEASG